MIDALSSASLFAVVLTLAAYELGLWLQKKTGFPLFNPILVSIAVIIPFLKLTGIPNSVYQAGSGTFQWLLTPATVCLAIPLYEQVQILKNRMGIILAGVLAGTAVSLGFIAGMCALFSMPDVLTASLLPKSITTAMGIVVAGQMGGDPAVATAAIVVTGIFGSIVGTPLCRLLHIDDPIAQGAAFGTSAHVVGTSRANQISPLVGAVSSLSLVAAGIVTALVCPLIW